MLHVVVTKLVIIRFLPSASSTHMNDMIIIIESFSSFESPDHHPAWFQQGHWVACLIWTIIARVPQPVPMFHSSTIFHISHPVYITIWGLLRARSMYELSHYELMDRVTSSFNWNMQDCSNDIFRYLGGSAYLTSYNNYVLHQLSHLLNISKWFQPNPSGLSCFIYWMSFTHPRGDTSETHWAVIGACRETYFCAVISTNRLRRTPGCLG